MIEKKNLIAEVTRRLASLEGGHYIDIRSYKRDRSVVVVKRPDGVYRIIINGFDRTDQTIASSELRSRLRAVLKSEFPRSNKLRLYEMGPFSDEMGRPLKRQRI